MGTPDPSERESEALEAADFNIYGDSVGGWFAWNGKTRQRIKLFPVPEGSTWRHSLHRHAPNGSFAVAVQVFERLIGPYYESRRGAGEYRQNHTYTVADLWDAFEAGAREAGANGGNPTDDLIRQSADAYCKMVHPRARTEPETREP